MDEIELNTNIRQSELTDVLKSETQFVPAGTLIKPGIIGRGVRLFFALAIFMFVLPGIVVALPFFSTSTRAPDNIFFWIIIVIAFLNLNHVVNLGLGQSWGRKPQYVLVVLLLVAVFLDIALYQSLWAPPLGLLLYAWLLAEFIPLGIAFLLAGILATPGCEMRSYHHLVALILRQEPTEHFCPGGVDFADHWELNLKRKKPD